MEKFKHLWQYCGSALMFFHETSQDTIRQPFSSYHCTVTPSVPKPKKLRPSQTGTTSLNATISKWCMHAHRHHTVSHTSKQKAQEPAVLLLLRSVHTDVCFVCVCSRFEQVCVVFFFFFLFLYLWSSKARGWLFFSAHQKKERKKWVVHHLREFRGFPSRLPEIKGRF